MQFQNIIGAIACAVAIFFASACSKEAQAEPPQRTAEDLINGMRLKALTKNLELTGEQQGKVQELLTEEAEQIAKIRADANASLTQQSVKIGELKKETYGKIKPLLTPEQTEKLEKMINKPEGRRRRS